MIVPVHIAHPFPKGQIAHNPVPNLPRAQGTVQSRYDDGSVRHAWFFMLVEGDLNQIFDVSFNDVLTVDAKGLDFAAMSAAIYPIEVQLWNQDFTVMSASLNLHDVLQPQFIKTLSAGPVATYVEVADHTGSFDFKFAANALYDPNGNPTVRPIWEITFWPTIERIDVLLRMEAGNGACIQESWYATRIIADSVKAFEHPWDVQGHGSTWFWEYWQGGKPERVAINHNLMHMASTGAAPNFDTSFQVDAKSINDWKARYPQLGLSDLRYPSDQSNNGIWFKGMGTAGTRTDLGFAHEVVIDYLYSGDADLAEICYAEAKRACLYPIMYREFAPTFKGYQGPFRVDDRPALDIIQPTNFADGFHATGDMDSHGWIPDREHQPNPWYAMYLTHGRKWMLDYVLMWSCYGVAVTNGATSDHRGRGPTGKEGCVGLPQFFGTRGPAHILRNLAQAAWICPDASSYKQYLTTCVMNSIAAYEGTHRITGTQFENTPCWIWGRDAEDNSNPMHWHDKYSPGDPLVDSHIKPNTVRTTVPTWEQSFMDVTWRILADLGFPVKASIDWRIAGYKQLLPYPLLAGLQTPTWLPCGGMDGNLFTTAQQIHDTFVDDYDFEVNFYGPLDADKNHGYSVLATAAALALGDPDLVAWYLPNSYRRTSWNGNPKWAILPRL